MTNTRERSRQGRAIGVLVAAAMAFLFVLGLSGEDDPLIGRLAAGMAAMAASITIFLLGEVLLALKGVAGEGFPESVREKEMLEQEKTRLLTAIKEIDFDHAMKKINDGDHSLLRSRYEAQALKVILLLDHEEVIFRERAEALARARLKDLCEPDEERPEAS